MFRNLMQFWKGRDFLSQVLEEYRDMLEDTHEIYGMAFGALFEEEADPELKDRIYAIDRKVNAHQKDIRKRIVEHLSVQPSVDTAACLLLMSVVKDAERIGDFSKNIYEVRTLLDKPLEREAYASFFNGTDEDIVELFRLTVEAFLNSDEEKAKATWEIQRRLKEKSNAVIHAVAKGGGSVNEAVCYALLARYFRRIASHLTNIATSVVVPLSDLDYFEKEQSGR